MEKYMSKLQALLEKQKEIQKAIDQAIEEEKAKHKSEFIGLYSKLKLDRFTTQQIQNALSSLSDDKKEVKSTSDQKQKNTAAQNSEGSKV